MSRTLVAKQLGVARSTLYYQSRLAVKDEQLRQDILQVLHLHPSYGYRRLAIHLGINKKRALRVSPTAAGARSLTTAKHLAWRMLSYQTSLLTTFQWSPMTSGPVTLPTSHMRASSSTLLLSWTCIAARWLAGMYPTAMIRHW